MAAMALGALVSVTGSLIANARQTTSEPVVQKTDKAPKPVTKDDPNAQQVAETPLTDLNVKKGEIRPFCCAPSRIPIAWLG
jgi:hypothetical protein